MLRRGRNAGARNGGRLQLQPVVVAEDLMAGLAALAAAARSASAPGEGAAERGCRLLLTRKDPAQPSFPGSSRESFGGNAAAES